MRRTLLLLLSLATPCLAAAADPASALARIKQSGTIRLGYLEAAPPFLYLGPDQAPAGYSVDLCKSVAEGIGKQLGLGQLRTEWVKLDRQNRLTAVAAGKVDVECGVTTWTLSRQETVDFSLMTFIDGGTVLVRAESELFRLADLAGKRVAIVPGTTTVPELTRALKVRGLAAEMVEVASPAAAVSLRTAGQVDGFASDRLVLLGLGLQAQGASSLRLLDEDFSVEAYALALPRGDYELRLAVNRQLARLYRSAGIDLIYNKWFGALGRPGMLLTALYLLQGIPE
jgi:polar amino acid transport system substrate-binding protein/glutamate/aspartate transport system substrate-binding protein